MISQRKAGVLLSYLAQVIHILSGLIYTPIMLRLLGQSEYGLYQLVYSVVSYLGLLSFGFSSSYMRFYSRYKAKNDDEKIAKLNGMFMTIFLGIAIICIICGIIMINNIHAIFENGLNSYEYDIAKILMMLMILSMALTFPSSVFDSFTSAYEKFFFQKLLVVLQNILNPFLTLPLLIMGFGSIGMVVVSTILTFAKLVVNAWYCIKKLKIEFCFKQFNFKLLKEMWVFTFFIFVSMIVDQINWSVDKFLLGRFAGTAAVAVYGVGGQLNSLYLQLSTTISSVFIPKVNAIVAETDDNHTLTLLFTKVGRIQFIILSMVLSGFVFLGQPFIRFWAGEGYEVSYAISLLLMTPVTVPLIQNLGIEIQRAKNMHRVRSIVYLFIAVSNIFVSIPCIKAWGASGAAIGTALTLTLGNGLFMNWYYHKKIGLDIIYFWKQIFSFVPALSIPVVLGVLVLKYMNDLNIITFLCVGCIYVLVFCACIWRFGLNDEEKSMLMIIRKR